MFEQFLSIDSYTFYTGLNLLLRSLALWAGASALIWGVKTIYTEVRNDERTSN